MESEKLCSCCRVSVWSLETCRHHQSNNEQVCQLMSTFDNKILEIPQKFDIKLIASIFFHRQWYLHGIVVLS